MPDLKPEEGFFVDINLQYFNPRIGEAEVEIGGKDKLIGQKTINIREGIRIERHLIQVDCRENDCFLKISRGNPIKGPDETIVIKLPLNLDTQGVLRTISTPEHRG